MRAVGWWAVVVGSGRLHELPAPSPRGGGGRVQAGAHVWIRSGAGVAFSVVLDQLRREHFTGSVWAAPKIPDKRLVV
jgi:hypothetical protein